MNYYIPPKQKSPIQLVLTISFIGVISFILSYVYGIGSAIIPSLYLNIPLVLFFGITLGYVVRVACKIFKIFDKKLIIKLSIIVGVFNLYFSWVAYILYYAHGANSFDAYFSNHVLLFRPDIIINVMKQMYTHGAWDLYVLTQGSWTANGGILVLIWIIEAIIIIGTPIILILKHNITPFSIKEKKWYKKYELKKEFDSIAMRDKFIQKLSKDCINTIAELKNGSTQLFARISIYYLNNEDKQYISIENISRSRDGSKTNSRLIIQYLEISTLDAKLLIEAYHGEEIFVFDY